VVPLKAKVAVPVAVEVFAGTSFAALNVVEKLVAGPDDPQAAARMAAWTKTTDRVLSIVSSNGYACRKVGTRHPGCWTQTIQGMHRKPVSKS
jgi:hypothetical protein